MDLVCNAASHLVYLPLRAMCMRWCGQHQVELLEDVMSASSSQVSGLGWPFESPRSVPLPVQGDVRARLRTRLLERVLEQPFRQARAARMAAHLAAQAAQVDFAFSFDLSKF